MASEAGIFDAKLLAPDQPLYPQHNPQTSTPGLPVAAAKTCYQGCMIAYDPANSQAQPADPAMAATAVVIGVAEETVDNADGAKGDLKIRPRAGVWRMKSDGNLTAAHLYKPCRVVDDHTVGVPAGTDADRIAGLFVGLDGDYAWVLIMPSAFQRGPLTVPVTSTNGVAAAAIPGALTSTNGVAAAAIPGALTSTDGVAAAAAADLAALAAEAEKIGDDTRAIHAAMLLAQAENEKIGDDVRAIHAAFLLLAAEVEKIGDDVRATRSALVTLGLIAPAA